LRLRCGGQVKHGREVSYLNLISDAGSPSYAWETKCHCPSTLHPSLPLAARPLFVLTRFGPDAVLRLLAGAIAVLTRDEKRGKRCLEVLRILRNKDKPPPPLP
jgi:hypothetical protein